MTCQAKITQPPQEKGEEAMKINWENQMNEALEKAKNQAKPVLLDFFNPG